MTRCSHRELGCPVEYHVTLTKVIDFSSDRKWTPHHLVMVYILCAVCRQNPVVLLENGYWTGKTQSLCLYNSKWRNRTRSKLIRGETCSRFIFSYRTLSVSMVNTCIVFCFPRVFFRYSLTQAGRWSLVKCKLS